MKLIKYYGYLPSLFLIVSCATKFSKEQRNALSSVAIARTEVKGDAYHEPYGGDLQTANGAAVVGVSSGTGAIGGVLGALIGQSIAATQNSMFRSKEKHSFEAVKSNTPDVGSILNSKLAGGIKQEPFFGPRIQKDSPNTIISTVNSYQLVRSGKEKNGNLLFAPRVAAKLSLRDASGKDLFSGSYIGVGYSNPLAAYASNKLKTKEGYEIAAGQVINQFTSNLAKKVAE